MTADRHVNDEHWDRFVKDFEATRTVAVAAPGAAAGPAQAEAVAPRRRMGLRFTVGLVLLAGLAGGAYAYGPWHGGATTPTARASTGTASGTASKGTHVTPAKASSGGALTPSSALAPEQAFPAAVGDYVKVEQLSVPTCTQSPAVQPTLAGLVVQGHGCLGMSFALYTDPAKNEFTVAVLTLKNPVDAPATVTALAANPTDVQVGSVIPSAAAGLRMPRSDDGSVQQFASDGPYVLVGVASWSDGHRSDYQKLEDRLTPLFQAVTKKVGSYALG